MIVKKVKIVVERAIFAICNFNYNEKIVLYYDYDGWKGHRWLRVYTLIKETKELKRIISQRMKCAYVEKYIQKPFIDENKLFVLGYIYKDTDIPESLKKRYITTIMLVQIALDTHELIPSNDNIGMSETEKQLSVLAGDYYSGLYYLLLSEIEDIPMIKTLANAIQYINEQKMKLFYEDVSSLDELMETIKAIETSLFTEAVRSIDKDHYFIPIIKEVLFIHKLMKEKEQIHEGKFSYIANFVNKNIGIVDYEHVIEIIDKELDESKEQLDKLLVQLPYQFVLLKNIIRSKYGIIFNKSVAEEG